MCSLTDVNVSESRSSDDCPVRRSTRILLHTICGPIVISAGVQ